MNHNPQMLRYRPSFTRAWNTSSRVALPATTLLVWGVVAFSAMTWGLRWSAASEGLGLAAVAMPTTPDVDVSAAARSLGAAPVQATAAPTLASRFQLQGVLTEFILYSGFVLFRDQELTKLYSTNNVLRPVNVCHSEVEMFNQKLALMQEATTVSVHRDAWAQLTDQHKDQFRYFLVDRGITGAWLVK